MLDMDAECVFSIASSPVAWFDAILAHASHFIYAIALGEADLNRRNPVGRL